MLVRYPGYDAVGRALAGHFALANLRLGFQGSQRLGKPWETTWMDIDQNTRNSASNEGGNRLHGYFGTSIFRLFKPTYELALFFAGHISAILQDNILFCTRQRPKCDATTGKANACLMRMGSTIHFRIWFASLGACMAESEHGIPIYVWRFPHLITSSGTLVGAVPC